MARILVVEDNRFLRKTLVKELSDRGYEVQSASDGESALRETGIQRFDLVLLDLLLPDANGLDLLGRLRGGRGSAPLILSGLGSPGDRIRGLRAGADDYLSKPFVLEELLAHVQALLRRGTPAPREGKGSSDPFRAGDMVLDPAGQRLWVPSRWVPLTPIEFCLMQDLMLHQGELRSPEDLLQAVWQQAPREGDPGWVRWHLRNLRLKVEEDPSRPRRLLTIPWRGYRLQVEGEPGEPPTGEASPIAGELLVAFSEATRDALVALDRKGRVRFWNEAATRLMGYTRDQAMGADLCALLAPRFRPFLPAERRQRGQAPDGPDRLPAEVRRSDGTYLPVEASCTPCRLRGSEYRFWILRPGGEEAGRENPPPRVRPPAGEGPGRAPEGLPPGGFEKNPPAGAAGPARRRRPPPERTR